MYAYYHDDADADVGDDADDADVDVGDDADDADVDYTIPGQACRSQSQLLSRMSN